MIKSDRRVIQGDKSTISFVARFILLETRFLDVVPRYTGEEEAAQPMGLLVIFSPHFFFFSSPPLAPLPFSRGGLTDGRSKRRGRSPLAWRGLQPSTALLATGQSLCQVSTYRPTWIFSGLRRNDRGPAFSFFASL